MGLDMYLYAEKYVGSKPYLRATDPEVYEQVTRVTGLASLVPNEENFLGHMTVQVCVAYWRKANAIHDWFVQNVQNGVDECQKSHVEMDQLVQLRKTCATALELYEDGNPDAAGKILTPTSGFFFGSTELDEWYAHDLKHTIEQLDPLILADLEGEHLDFYYRSSW